jgi:hypothetical protein
MLATVAVAASISISLAPAHIAFFVRDANKDHETTAFQDGKLVHGNFWFYNLTLVANNTSHRTAVSYSSIIVNIWWSETSWTPTDEVNTSIALPGWLLPGSTALVKVGVEAGQYNKDQAKTMTPPLPPPPPPPSQGSVKSNSGGGVAKWPECRVVVEAKVRFRFAGVPTLPYTVRVSCFPVNFLDGTSSPVNCTG